MFRTMQTRTRELIKIVDYEPQYQQAVEDVVLPIQQIEFGLPYPREQQPDLLDIPGVFQKGKGGFWVALHEGVVIGTIGIVDIGNAQAALKKMFVHKDYRGKEHGVAAALLENAMEQCRVRGIKSVFLGTVGHYFAAHRFYEKNEFVEVAKETLPPAFPIVHVDTKFYRRELG
jgi:GNAT superfamily N-acetyltransferase